MDNMMMRTCYMKSASRIMNGRILTKNASSKTILNPNFRREVLIIILKRDLIKVLNYSANF